MPRGRPRTPTALKLLRGNPGKRPISEREPKPPEGPPTCPRHLDAKAKQEWKRVSKLLLAMGLLTKVDRAALAAYCQIYSRWVQAEDMVRKHGMVVVVGKEKQYIQKSPYLSIAERSLEMMDRYLRKFGLSPADRSGLEVPNPIDEEEDELDRLLSRTG